MHGHWRGAVGGAQDSDRQGRVEGLNEDGEAPPPYKPAGCVSGDEARRDGPRAPESVLLRDDVGMKPPDYDETYVGSSREGTISPEAMSPVLTTDGRSDDGGHAHAPSAEHYAPA